MKSIDYHQRNYGILLTQFKAIINGIFGLSPRNFRLLLTEYGSITNEFHAITKDILDYH